MPTEIQTSDLRDIEQRGTTRNRHDAKVRSRTFRRLPFKEGNVLAVRPE
jgi:hypothetical protein